MSFTQDELQALNAIFDQKMAILRRELERSLDQRMHAIRREFEQRLAILLQDSLRTLARRLSDQQHKLRDGLYHRLDQQQSHITRTITQQIEQQQQAVQPQQPQQIEQPQQPQQIEQLQPSQQLEDIVERALAAQLIAIEQLINQRLPISAPEIPLPYTSENQPDFDAIEVQTEIPWEDLVELVDKALDTRLASLTGSLQNAFHDLEQSLTIQMHNVWRDMLRARPLPQDGNGADATIQDLFTGLVQLEELVESMQVAMTANSALISNRLYHHQQLPLERAHPSQKALTPQEQQITKPDAASSTTEDE